MTPLDSCTVELYNDASEMIFAAETDAAGYYEFPGLLNGDYTVKTSCSKTWGGLNGLDIILTKRFIASLHTFTPIQKMAADVNENGSPDGLDVIM